MNKLSIMDDYRRKLFLKIKQYIEEKACKIRKMTDIMDSFNLDYQELKDGFIYMYGMTPKEYIRQLKFDKLKRMIKDSEFKEEISGLCISL